MLATRSSNDLLSIMFARFFVRGLKKVEIIRHLKIRLSRQTF
jgi:hypothetical protein